ncbi:uncharacterized protein N7469_002101 [Penicillium citrinum]|uniref:Uncharacterized protein n=1 Tax=Penicillium citrinum TaxID=5077 RepID=A0A9W9PA07_PENCI|nr:uncharacterized protein N7469_002101 [Penicillium citrinum]KAJ5240510.1 hypothetical protein N7469_002101 [Penicillium citrinum]
MKIAGESKESQTIGEQLKKELLILTKGSETCKWFARTKTEGMSNMVTGDKMRDSEDMSTFHDFVGNIINEPL